MHSCIQIYYEQNQYPIESIWINLVGAKNKWNMVVGVSYRPPNQEEKVDETFEKEIARISKRYNVVGMEDFNYLDIC